MREILFRGKRNRDWKKHKTGEWVMGCLWHHTNNSAIIYSDELDDKVWVFAETVGQFTGLTDKNGKKIFEGDILRAHYFAEPDEEWDNIYVVDMVGGAWVETYVEDGTLSTEYVPDNLLLYSYADSEIIGNIHDNPELLEYGGT